MARPAAEQASSALPVGRSTGFHALSDAPAVPLNAIVYRVQPGDTLQGLANRFQVTLEEIRSLNELGMSDLQLLDPGWQLMLAPGPASGVGSEKLLPDSEIVLSPSVVGFDIAEFVTPFGGYLSAYRQRIDGEWISGSEVVARAAREHSVNPRLLLAILEYRSGWLTNPDFPADQNRNFPIWEDDGRLQGLYLQLTWVANELSEAYYGWRGGDFRGLTFTDGTVLPIPPDLNAGTAAVQHLLSHFYYYGSSYQAASPGDGLMATYIRLFGEPWAYQVPLFGPGVSQPSMSLPFAPDHPWLFTGGPHGAWGPESGWAAVDFAPKWDRDRRTSDNEVIAVADSVVARIDPGVVVLDLDGDGHEATGWAVMYLHVIPSEGIGVGSVLAQGELVGYASEVGGVTHGLHLHIARKYNGEWISADGPLPMELGGWRVRAGAEPYQGVLFREGCELLACPCASQDLLSVGGGEAITVNIQSTNLLGCCPSPTQPNSTTVISQPAGELSQAQPGELGIFSD
ncbi:MAG: LysM peptidoglycan-binding domain-containing protein [Anaerolineales bacterium]